MSFHTSMFLLALVCCPAASGRADPVPPGKAVPAESPVLSPVKEVLNVPYTLSGDPKQRLDIYYPTQTPHPTVLVFVPGSGWQTGDKKGYTELGHTFAEYYSYTTVVLNYRLSNSEDGDAVHPEHVKDVAKAFAWIKARISDYGGNPRQIFLFGQSAGGHLASLLVADEQYLRGVGCAPSDVRGVIAMSGLYNLPDFVVYPFNPLGLGLRDTILYKGMFYKPFGGWDEEALSDASPAMHVDAGQPPFRIVTTDNDMPGLRQAGTDFFDVLVRTGGPRPDAVHLNRSDYSDEVWNECVIMADEKGFSEEVVGHWAEVAAINTTDPESPSTMAIVEFVENVSAHR